jgi:ABC-type glutathione transport system ATPase component
VLLLDELTTFLDFEDAGTVLDAVRAVVRQGDGITAVWVTHRLEELRAADAVTYMEGGEILESGSPERVLQKLRSLGAAV